MALDHWARCKEHCGRREFRLAVQAGRQAWDRRGEVDAETRACIVLDFAYALGMVGDYYSAVDVAREGVELKPGSPVILSRLLQNLGHWLAKSNRIDQGIAVFKQSARVARASCEPKEWAFIYVGLAYWLIETGEIDEAECWMKDARPVMEEYGEQFAGFAHLNQGRIHLLKGETPEAWRMGRAALVRCRDKHPHVAARALCLLSEIAAATGQMSQAQELATAAQGVALAAGRDDIHHQASRLLVAFERR